jgi:prefoldin subunit 2
MEVKVKLLMHPKDNLVVMPPKATTSQPKLTPQEVPAVFQRYRTELQNLAQKIGELESEMEEHA